MPVLLTPFASLKMQSCPAPSLPHPSRSPTVSMWSRFGISTARAPGTSADNVYRPGGPVALVTSRCLFTFDRSRRRFELASVHPGHTVAEVAENTGFAFDHAPLAPVTPSPSAETLRILRSIVAPQLVEVYPRFAADVFGVAEVA